jgi:hypothetical protein
MSHEEKYFATRVDSNDSMVEMVTNKKKRKPKKKKPTDEEIAPPVVENDTPTPKESTKDDDEIVGYASDQQKMMYGCRNAVSSVLASFLAHSQSLTKSKFSASRS